MASSLQCPQTPNCTIWTLCENRTRCQIPAHAGTNSQLPRVYELPMLTNSMGKGSCIVTSVPSNAPDDSMGTLSE